MRKNHFISNLCRLVSSKLCLFTLIFICFAFVSINTQAQKPLKLSIHSPEVIDSDRQKVEQILTIGAKVRYTVSLVNISDKPVKVIDPYKSDRWWGTHRAESITTLKAKSDTSSWFVEPSERSFSKKCVVDLPPNDSIIVYSAWVTIKDTVPTKLVVNYEQFPEGVSDEVIKQLGADFVRDNKFRITSAPLYIKPVYPKVIPDKLDLSIEELSQPPIKVGPTSYRVVYGTYDLKSLLTDAMEDYVQVAYKISINPKSMEYARFLPLFKNVRWLEIEMGYGDSIPKEIAQLDKLIYLDIKGSVQKDEKKYEVYIEPIKDLKKLQEIKLANTFVQTSTWLSNFQQLRKAYFFNAFREYNASLGSLKNMEDLFLDGGAKQTLPVELSSLKNLKKLTLFKFSTKIDEKILPALTGLQTLFFSQHAAEYPNFSGCNVKTMILYQTLESPQMPQGLSSNTQLDSLILTYKSKDFPDLNGCKNLRTLTINNDMLETLPENTGNLENLKSLKLSTKTLSGLPESIGNLQKLTVLDVVISKIENLPQSIGNLPALKNLSVEHSAIKEFPGQVEKLANLRLLSLRNNQLTNVPASITNMNNLELLYVENNQLTSLPEGLFAMPTLKFIWVKNNPFDKSTNKLVSKAKEEKRIQVY